MGKCAANSIGEIVDMKILLPFLPILVPIFCFAHNDSINTLLSEYLTSEDVIETKPHSITIQDASAITVIQNNDTKYLTLLGLGEKSVLYVYDSFGRLMLTRTFPGDRESISTNFWPTGIYIVRISSKTGFFSKKVLIK